MQKTQTHKTSKIICEKQIFASFFKCHFLLSSNMICIITMPGRINHERQERSLKTDMGLWLYTCLHFFGFHQTICAEMMRFIIFTLHLFIVAYVWGRGQKMSNIVHCFSSIGVSLMRSLPLFYLTLPVFCEFLLVLTGKK